MSQQKIWRTAVTFRNTACCSLSYNFVLKSKRRILWGCCFPGTLLQPWMGQSLFLWNIFSWKEGSSFCWQWFTRQHLRYLSKSSTRQWSREHATFQAICFACFAAVSKLCYVHGYPSMMLLIHSMQLFLGEPAPAEAVSPARSLITNSWTAHLSLAVLVSAQSLERSRAQTHNSTSPSSSSQTGDSCLFSAVSWAKDLHLIFSCASWTFSCQIKTFPCSLTWQNVLFLKGFLYILQNSSLPYTFPP